MLHRYIYRSMPLHTTYLPDIRTYCDDNQLFAILYAKYLVKMLLIVLLRNKNVLKPDQSDTVPARNSTSTRSCTISNYNH